MEKSWHDILRRKRSNTNNGPLHFLCCTTLPSIRVHLVVREPDYNTITILLQCRSQMMQLGLRNGLSLEDVHLFCHPPVTLRIIPSKCASVQFYLGNVRNQLTITKNILFQLSGPLSQTSGSTMW